MGATAFPDRTCERLAELVSKLEADEHSNNRRGVSADIRSLKLEAQRVNRMALQLRLIGHASRVDPARFPDGPYRRELAEARELADLEETNVTPIRPPRRDDPDGRAA